MAKKKKRAATTTGNAKHRPKKADRLILTKDYPDIEKLWATGCSYGRIARKYNVTRAQIQKIFRTHIFPSVTASHCRTIEAELIKISALESVAWEKFYSEAPAETREQLKEILGTPNEANQSVSKKLVEKMEKTSSKVFKPGQKAWLDVVSWCIDQRCKMEGHYAPSRVKVDTEEFRVAGRTPGEVNAEMVKRLMTKVAERKAYETRLRDAGDFPSLSPSRN